MAIWLWIYGNDFAMCNWSIAQPSIQKKCSVNNLSFFKHGVFSPLVFRWWKIKQLYKTNLHHKSELFSNAVTRRLNFHAETEGSENTDRISSIAPITTNTITLFVLWFGCTEAYELFDLCTSTNPIKQI